MHTQPAAPACAPPKSRPGPATPGAPASRTVPLPPADLAYAPPATPAWAHSPATPGAPARRTVPLPPADARAPPPALVYALAPHQLAYDVRYPGNPRFVHACAPDTPACAPPRALTLVVPGPQWRASLAPGATVQDVLAAVHGMLQAPVDPSESMRFPPPVRQTGLQAHHTRTAGRPQFGPPMRVDFLMPNVVLVGLVASVHEADTWELQFAPLRQ